MKQIRSEDELIGKKIKSADEIDDYFFIFFEDETFCVFHSPRTIGVETELMKDIYHPSFAEGNSKKMLEHGFYTQKQYDSSKNSLDRLRETIARQKILDDEQKKREEEYKEMNKDKFTECCRSKNHFLYQGLPYCHECNSVCELEY